MVDSIRTTALSIKVDAYPALLACCPETAFPASFKWDGMQHFWLPSPPSFWLYFFPYKQWINLFWLALPGIIDGFWSLLMTSGYLASDKAFDFTCHLQCYHSKSISWVWRG